MGIVYVVNADRLPTPAFIDYRVDITDFESGFFMVSQDDITADLQRPCVAANLVVTGSMDNTPFLAYIRLRRDKDGHHHASVFIA